ncbi:MAG: leucyl aminopeptidase [Longimicrobiales bacterium]
MADVRVATVRASADQIRTPLLVVQLFERDRAPVGSAAEIDRVAGGVITRVLERGDFAGRKDELMVLYPSDPESSLERVMLVGAGRREDFTLERLRRAVGTAVRQAERMGIAELAFSLGHAEQLSEHMGNYYTALGATEASVLAAWDFRELKTQSNPDERKKPIESVTLIAADEEQEAEFRRAAAHGEVTARSANLARLLAARPGNVATPTHLAEVAQGIASEFGMGITVLDREAMKQEGMKSLLAVAQGTHEEPRFIVLEHMAGAKDEQPLVLIGKGVTFDSGGISIKPADRMEDMKYDMSGAASVLGAMRGIAELKVRANVVGIVPSTENLPSGHAVKPGDVIGSHLGKTIEVINTDAEGRLILVDALSYARRYNPAAMLDAATLTGAVVIALGHHAIGLMGNDGDLIDEVRAAGQRVGERCWPLPLWDEYREQLDSSVADIKNSGGRPAGSITGGWFLKEFAGETPWVHLDIAGTAYREEAAPYLRKGPTGVPTRLFIEWVRSRSD